METQENSTTNGAKMVGEQSGFEDSSNSSLASLATSVLQKSDHASLHEFRVEALNKLEKSRPLNSKTEDWKYTNFQKFLKPLTPLSSEATIDEVNFLSSAVEKIVFVNGKFNSSLSNLTSKFVQLINCSTQIPANFTSKRTILEGNSSELKVLSDATFDQILFIDLTEKSELEMEIVHLVFDNISGSLPGDSNLTYVAPRIYVGAKEDSKLKMFEHFLGFKEESYFTNHVIEFNVATGSDVEHIIMQRGGVNAVHGSTILIEQAEKSKFKTVAVNFGSKIARNEIYPSIQGPNSEAWLIGANVISQDQIVDNFTVIDHVAPDCESHELYKGMYGGSSKGVFSGTIIVRQEAQKTNAYQSNSSLLCSENSESNSRPQLKIWADDVKCSHGATVGQIDEEALFYLMARGIPENSARLMLTRAYVSEAFSHISDSTLKSNIESLLELKLAELL